MRLRVTRRRLGLVASCGSSSSVPWAANPLNIFFHVDYHTSHGTSARGPALVPDAELPRGCVCVLSPRFALHIASSSWFSRGEWTNLLVTSLVGTFVSFRRRISFLGGMGIQTREDVSRTRSPQVVCYEDVSWCRKRSRAHELLFRVDDVLVPVVTGHIVSRAFAIREGCRELASEVGRVSKRTRFNTSSSASDRVPEKSVVQTSLRCRCNFWIPRNGNCWRTVVSSAKKRS